MISFSKTTYIIIIIELVDSISRNMARTRSIIIIYYKSPKKIRLDKLYITLVTMFIENVQIVESFDKDGV